MDECQHRNSVEDAILGCTYCTECGAVLDSLSSLVSLPDFDSYDYKPIELTAPQNIQKLSREEKKQSSLKKDIQMAINAFDLPAHCIGWVQTKVTHFENKRTNRKHAILGALYAKIQMDRLPITLEELSDSIWSGIDAWAVSQIAHDLLQKETNIQDDINVPIRQDPSCHLERVFENLKVRSNDLEAEYCFNINWDALKMPVIHMAQDLCTYIIKPSWISTGRSSVGFAWASILISSVHFNPQTDVMLGRKFLVNHMGGRVCARTVDLKIKDLLKECHEMGVKLLPWLRTVSCGISREIGSKREQLKEWRLRRAVKMNHNFPQSKQKYNITDSHVALYDVKVWKQVLPHLGELMKFLKKTENSPNFSLPKAFLASQKRTEKLDVKIEAVEANIVMNSVELLQIRRLLLHGYSSLQLRSMSKNDRQAALAALDHF